MPRPSLRSLARQLDLSAATVSLALRDSPQVVPATKKRIVQAARRAGYRSNPLVRSVMAALRRASHDSYQGTLLAINYSDAETPELIRYHAEVLQGAQRRAGELGYTMALNWVGPKILSLRRLNAILDARNVQGLVVMPFANTHDFSALHWSNFAAVVMDYCLSTPVLHAVLPDHHLSLFNAMERLLHYGYRRPGLIMDAARDSRLKHKWSAGYSSYGSRFGADAIIPVLLHEGITREIFLRWFKRYQPDVVIGHLQEEATRWLGEIGVHIPRDVGFLQLNWTERTAPCAGLDLQPELLGAAAVEAVVAQLQRNERGVPANPKTITLAAKWIDGPTLRAPTELKKSPRPRVAVTARPSAKVSRKAR